MPVNCPIFIVDEQDPTRFVVSEQDDETFVIAEHGAARKYVYLDGPLSVRIDLESELGVCNE